MQMKVYTGMAANDFAKVLQLHLEEVRAEDAVRGGGGGGGGDAAAAASQAAAQDGLDLPIPLSSVIRHLTKMVRDPAETFDDDNVYYQRPSLERQWLGHKDHPHLCELSHAACTS